MQAEFDLTIVLTILGLGSIIIRIIATLHSIQRFAKATKKRSVLRVSQTALRFGFH